MQSDGTMLLNCDRDAGTNLNQWVIIRYRNNQKTKQKTVFWNAKILKTCPLWTSDLFNLCWKSLHMSSSVLALCECAKDAESHCQNIATEISSAPRHEVSIIGPIINSQMSWPDHKWSNEVAWS